MQITDPVPNAARPRGLLLAVLLLAGLTACAGEEPPPAEGVAKLPPTAYYDLAAEAGDWIRAQVIATDRGPIWPDDASDPDSATIGLGGGVSGTTLFFLELARAGEDGKWMSEVRRGGDWLLASLPESLEASSLGFPDEAAGLYGGWSGAGVVLHRVFLATGDTTYLDGAHRAVDLVVASAQSEDRGVSWNVYNEIMRGNAGTGLFLLYAAREMGREDAGQTARAAGEALLARSFPESGGVNWFMREDRDFVLPNFSHGAAGIGYFLATASRQMTAALEATGGDDAGDSAAHPSGGSNPADADAFARAAVSTADYLAHIARVDSLGALTIPYGYPREEWREWNELGWAHGPAGTGRFFYRVAELTGDPQYTEMVEGCARAIVTSGAPDQVTPRFAEALSPDRRFGLAGAAAFLFSLYEFFGDEDHKTTALRITDHLATRAEVDDNGRRWVMEQPEFFPSPGQDARYTGYFHGAAGYGLLLLQADAVLRGLDWTPGLPDTPF